MYHVDVNGDWKDDIAATGFAAVGFHDAYDRPSSFFNAESIYMIERKVVLAFTV